MSDVLFLPSNPAAKEPPGTARWLRVTAVALAACVAVASGFGVGALASRALAPATEPFEIYLTDAQAPIDRLDVEVGSVKVGRADLDVLHGRFDLASLHGPEDAILLARGDVPAGSTEPVRIHFTAVRATIGGATFTVPNPKDLVLDPRLFEDGLPDAALFDLDVPASVVQTAEGVAFDPRPAALYAIPELAEGQTPDWQAAAKAMPGADGVLAFATATGAPAALDATADGADAATHDARDLPGTAAGQAPDGTSADVRPVEAGLGGPGDAVPEAGTGWIVEFAEDTPEWRMRAAAELAGAVFVDGFESLPFAYVLADPGRAEILAASEDIVGIEPEVPIAFHDASSRQAIRQDAVVAPVTGLRDRAGIPIDGRGVGVAVVDTGIDTLHPDLPGSANAVVVANYKVESTQVVPLAHSDAAGHGTHVAAIVAGQGTQDADARGVAPGAKLYGLGVSEGSTNLWAAQAFDWILQNHDRVDPPIRIVTNSWGTGTDYQPRSIVNQFVNAMVRHGLVVVFSAGNLGGDGSAAKTSGECQNPTAGVVCVAAFDDLGTGTRDGTLPAYSSRGALASPSTWPDLSAPGTRIYSAKPPAGLTTGVDFNLNYVELTGTSQAAPHVTGVIALMLQAQPGLTPAAVEADLEATAYKYADGGAYDALGQHFAKGAGLVDAYAAVALVA